MKRLLSDSNPTYENLQFVHQEVFFARQLASSHLICLSSYHQIVHLTTNIGLSMMKDASI